MLLSYPQRMNYFEQVFTKNVETPRTKVAQ